MVATTCPKCGHEMTDQVWGCPHCGSSTGDDGEPGKDISAKGMRAVLLLFVLFPILLFLLHIFVPGM